MTTTIRFKLGRAAMSAVLALSTVAPRATAAMIAWSRSVLAP